MLAVNTACGSDAKNNNFEKEENMETTQGGQVVHLTKAEFLAKVYDFEKNPDAWKYEGDKPAIVDFYADWCRPCLMMAPILEDVKSQIGDQATIIKINVDENQALAAQYGIQSIPSLLIFKQGEVVWREVGVHRPTELMAALKKFL